MNVDKAKKRSKRLPPIVKRDVVKVIEKVGLPEKKIKQAPKPKPKEEEIIVEVTVHPEIIKKPIVVKPKEIIRELVPAILPKSQIDITDEIIEEIDKDGLPLSTVVFGKERKNKYGKYSYAEKFTAVSMMLAFAHDKDGVLVPNFELMERRMSIHNTTLKRWWADRANIISDSKDIVGGLKTIVSHDLAWLILEATIQLRYRMKDRENPISDENLIKIIDRGTNKISILDGDPTRKKRVDVFHHLPVKAIPPDTAI